MSEGFIDFDLGNIKDPNAPAPSGTYTLLCKDAEETTTKKDGLRQFHFTFQIAGDNEHSGKFVHDYCIVEGNNYAAQLGRFRVQEYARAMAPNGLTNINEFIERTCSVELSEEPPTENFNRASNRVVRVY